MHIYEPMYIPTLLYGSETWIVLNKRIRMITAAGMSYLRKYVTKQERYNHKCSNKKGIRTEASNKYYCQKGTEIVWTVVRTSEDMKPKQILEDRGGGIKLEVYMRQIMRKNRKQSLLPSYNTTVSSDLKDGTVRVSRNIVKKGI